MFNFKTIEDINNLKETHEIECKLAVVPDGSWSGNLFDFYYRILRKLTADLKVPFVLVDGIRQDDTIVHKALREALINTLVHADYSGRASVKIVKKPDGFLFRNPGVMRIPSDIAIIGGQSDCRNQTMHQMFLMIGLGERAGSGLPKIKEGWDSTNGTLELYDSYEPYEQTILEMKWGIKEKSSPKKEKTREKTREKIIDLIKENKSVSISEMAEFTGISTKGIEWQISNMKKEGILKRIGSPKGGHWVVINREQL